MKHVAGVLEVEGSDAWWRLGEDRLLPPDVVKQLEEEGKPLPHKVLSKGGRFDLLTWVNGR